MHETKKEFPRIAQSLGLLSEHHVKNLCQFRNVFSTLILVIDFTWFSFEKSARECFLWKIGWNGGGRRTDDTSFFFTNQSNTPITTLRHRPEKGNHTFSFSSLVFGALTHTQKNTKHQTMITKQFLFVILLVATTRIYLVVSSKTTVTLCSAWIWNISKKKKTKMMMKNENKHLVLVGGGHAHAQVIKALNIASRPKNLQVTLIDAQKSASYSGMVVSSIRLL